MQDYKEAMRNREVNKKEILNFVLGLIKYKKIELLRDLTDDDVLPVIKKEIKTRYESLGFLEKAGKVEDMQIEKEKVAVLEAYLPQMLSKEQITEIVKAVIVKLGITDNKKQRGMIIGEVMKDHKADIDGRTLNEVIESL